jgi:hypothetical protein
MSSDDPDDWPERALISRAKEHAAIARLLLESPRVKAANGNLGFYETALLHCDTIQHLVLESQQCADAEEFDALLYLIRCYTDGLVRAISQLRIP